MTVISKFDYRMMRSGEEHIVAEMIRALPLGYRPEARPALTAEALRDAAGLAEVTVCVEHDRVIAACLWTMTYSSWRAMPGIYISDLVVATSRRNLKLGEMLLKHTLRLAQQRGAGFVKMEVDCENEGAQRFYKRLGFSFKTDDQFVVLEPKEFNTLAGELA